MKNYFNLTLKVTLFVLIGLLSYSCSKDDPTPPPPIVIDPGDGDDDSFIALDPDLNDGAIEFETTGPSFDAENELNESNPNGTWGVFGGNGENKISIEYADNPSKSGVNTSDRVVKISEPVDVQSWAGFFFNLKEEISFPSGKEAVSVQFYSPGAGHNVLLKLEDQLSADDEAKKSTGDLFAITEGTGWETLIFNIPEKDGARDGLYNRFTMIAGYGVTNTEPVDYYIDNINFAEPKEVIIPDDPTTAPEAPTAPAAQVISIFSDAYTNIEGTDFNPNWGQSTVVTTETIAENTVLKYSNLNYQGTAFASNLDVSGKTKIHLDYFTGNATLLKFFLISPGPAEKAYELNVSDNPGAWNSVDIDLTHFSDVVDLTNIIQFKVEGTGTVYFDNIYFYGVNSAPSAAPAAPDKEASDVISIYSDSYTAAVNANTNPNWGQATVVTEETFGENKVLKYASLNYQGTDWASEALDVSGMEYLHFDYWTAEASDFNFFLISSGPKEKAYNPETVSIGTWVSVDIPLSDFEDVVDLADVIQFKVDDNGTGEGATIYFDNFYFWKESTAPTAPTTGSTAPTKDAADVKSIYSDTYTAAVTADVYPNWGQSTQYEEVDFENNKAIKYSNLNYQGMDWNSEALDVSEMTHINLDYWTADATAFDFFLIGGGKEKAYTVTTEKGTWNTISIELSNYGDVVDLSAVIQFKIDVQAHKTGTTIYFDNLYFSK